MGQGVRHRGRRQRRERCCPSPDPRCGVLPPQTGAVATDGNSCLHRNKALTVDSCPAGEPRDRDHDGTTNPQEYLAGTHPKDAGSALQIVEVHRLSDGRVKVIWDSSTNTVPGPHSYGLYAGDSIEGLLMNGLLVES